VLLDALVDTLCSSDAAGKTRIRRTFEEASESVDTGERAHRRGCWWTRCAVATRQATDADRMSKRSSSRAAERIAIGVSRPRGGVDSAQSRLVCASTNPTALIAADTHTRRRADSQVPQSSRARGASPLRVRPRAVASVERSSLIVTTSPSARPLRCRRRPSCRESEGRCGAGVDELRHHDRSRPKHENNYIVGGAVVSR
jgi:hypothetical protein